MLLIHYIGKAGDSNPYCVIAAAQYPCGLAAIPLANGETATITMPKQVSPPSRQMLIDPLELWKKQAGGAESSVAVARRRLTGDRDQRAESGLGELIWRVMERP